jgi:hypothetical protein
MQDQRPHTPGADASYSVLTAKIIKSSLER